MPPASSARCPRDGPMLRRTLSGWTSDADAAANLQIIYRSPKKSSARPRLEELLQHFSRRHSTPSGADRGCMLVTDPATTTIARRRQSVATAVDSSRTMPVSRSIVDYVLQTRRKACRTTDARDDQRFDTRPEHPAGRHPRGDLRADAGPLRHGGRDLHRHHHARRTRDPRAAAAADRFTEEHFG